MAQDVVVNGTTYPAVESVELTDLNGNKTSYYDLTGDSVTPETLLKGATAHDAKGNIIMGTIPIYNGEVV